MVAMCYQHFYESVSLVNDAKCCYLYSIMNFNNNFCVYKTIIACELFFVYLIHIFLNLSLNILSNQILTYLFYLVWSWDNVCAFGKYMDNLIYMIQILKHALVSDFAHDFNLMFFLHDLVKVFG